MVGITIKLVWCDQQIHNAKQFDCQRIKIVYLTSTPPHTHNEDNSYNVRNHRQIPDISCHAY
jgi:hypothetical protein